MIGELVAGRYQVLSLLGEGGMGSVYEAQERDTGRRVALKLLSTGHDDEKVVARFKREAKLAASVETRHIARVLDAGTDEATGRNYMVMELLDGEDLDSLLSRVGPLNVGGTLRIVAQALIGLQKAHDAGVIHRDIKPANLFVARAEGGERVVKILDFGIAKFKPMGDVSGETKGLTHTGAVMGSPIYMSPEQARGSKHIDHRTDVWSMGVVLYKALTGFAPFEHLDTLGELILHLCSRPAEPLSSVAPWVSSELSVIASRALSIDPAQRYPSAQAMLDDLRTLLPHDWSLGDVHLVPVPEDAKRQVISPQRLSHGPLGDLPTQSASDTTYRGVSGGAARPATAIRGLVLAVVVLGLGAVAAVLYLNGPGAGDVLVLSPALADDFGHAIALPSATVAPSASASVEASADVMVTIEAKPSDAAVFVDGDQVGLANQPLRLPRSDTEVTLTFKKVGFKDKTVTVTPSKDVVLSVSLDRKAAQLPAGHPDLESPL